MTEPREPDPSSVQGLHVLVTGGAGFIGSHVVDALLVAGHQVRVLDALLPAAHGEGARFPDWVDPCAERRTGDVRSDTDVEEALAGIDVVCHQAAMVGLGVDLRDLPAYVSCNDLGTAVLLRAMAGRVRHLVLASSMVVYGEGRYRCADHGAVVGPPRHPDDLRRGDFEPRCPTCGHQLEMITVDEDAPLDPRNVYAATKVAQEHLASAWAHETGSSVIALRYHNVYGPRMPRDTPYAGVASIFRSALARGEAPRVFEDGRQLRDFVHVRDVARANLRAIEKASAGHSVEQYNVASGRPRSVLQMARALADATRGPAPVVTGEFRVGDVRHIVASAERARTGLGFVATEAFDAGVRELADTRLRETGSAAGG
jgi:dTDP-L-rhamnose 4-epimerase